jgi:hypothetical protein
MSEGTPKAGIMEGAGDVQRTGRRFLGGLEDDRTTGRQSPGDLAGRLAHGEVPRRERRHRADRLVNDDVTDVRRAGNDAAIGPHSLAGIPFEELAATLHFKPCLRDRLAMLQRDRAGDFLGARLHQRDGAKDDFGTLRRRRLRPDPEALPCCLECVIEIRTGGDRKGADDRFIGWIEDRDRLLSRAPFASDIELKFRVSRHSHTLFVWLRQDARLAVPALAWPAGIGGTVWSIQTTTRPSH